MNPHYPITLLLQGRLCLVVGGGRVAARKIAPLLKAGASVRVVATEPAAAVLQLAAEEAIDLHIRDFRDDDLQDAFLVIAATDDAELNSRVSGHCRRRGVLVNVVDCPALCSFYVPAVIRRGPVSIAIATGGTCPALARHLRVLLEDTVTEEYGHLAQLMAELRGRVMDAYDEQADRAAAWERLLASDILDQLSSGVTDEARRFARRVLGLEQ
jgi:siroheme synthase-like protein